MTKRKFSLVEKLKGERRLLPVLPTREMIKEGGLICDDEGVAIQVWMAMLAAAPRSDEGEE